MHNAGYAPRLYATFNNGLAYEFVPGDTLTTETCRAPAIFPLVATMMARMHRLECEDAPHEPMVWAKTRHFISLAPDIFSLPDKQKRYANYHLVHFLSWKMHTHDHICLDLRS
jgi:ethanolamine kinase